MNHFDLLVIGGGLNGAAVARDAAGRGLKVILAEQDDYASGMSGASSKLLHSGLQCLESFRLTPIRRSLRERTILQIIAPHLVRSLRILLPLHRRHEQPAWILGARFRIYDLLSAGTGFPRTHRLDRMEIKRLPFAEPGEIARVLAYHDCQVDDARLVLSLLLDARARGADISNRRRVSALRPLENGYAAQLLEHGARRVIEARFVINATGPRVTEVLSDLANSARAPVISLARCSHIVVPMPSPGQVDAYAIRNSDGNTVFVTPWLSGRFLLIGATEGVHSDAVSNAECTIAEREYLLRVVNKQFRYGMRPLGQHDIAWAFAGVAALAGNLSKQPGRINGEAELLIETNGTGAMISIVGGKLVTHRAVAEQVLSAIQRFGIRLATSWSAEQPVWGGGLDRAALKALADAAPEIIPPETALRWVFTYGDRTETLYERVRIDRPLAHDIATGVPEVELWHAVEEEDALTAEDFLYRRTKLGLILGKDGRNAVTRWFANDNGLYSGRG